MARRSLIRMLATVPELAGLVQRDRPITWGGSRPNAPPRAGVETERAAPVLRRLRAAAEPKYAMAGAVDRGAPVVAHGALADERLLRLSDRLARIAVRLHGSGAPNYDHGPNKGEQGNDNEVTGVHD